MAFFPSLYSFRGDIAKSDFNSARPPVKYDETPLDFRQAPFVPHSFFSNNEYPSLITYSLIPGIPAFRLLRNMVSS